VKHEGRPSPRFLTYILFVCSVGIALAVGAAADAPDWLVVLLIVALVLGSAAQRYFPLLWRRGDD
jgi:hypothetical protein